MAAVPIVLLERPPAAPPEAEEAPTAAAPIGPEEFEIIFDTDTLITACNCSSSSDNPYQ